MGDPFQEGVEQGPQVDEDQLKKVKGRLCCSAAGCCIVGARLPLRC